MIIEKGGFDVLGKPLKTVPASVSHFQVQIIGPLKKDDHLLERRRKREENRALDFLTK